ncbi:MAG: exonuclease domain-containing protein [Acidimicrobiales bacterium]
MLEMPLPSWADGELVGFDLETTGTDPEEALPVSFSFVRFLGREPVRVTTSLVDPGCEIPLGAQAVHHITTERAQSEGMPLAEAATAIVGALLDASARSVPVVGMNVAYDLTIADRLSRTYNGAGLYAAGFSAPVLDALVLDRHLDPFRKGRRRLSDLCALYGVVEGDLHDACADAAMSVRVVLAIADRSPEIRLAPPGLLTSSQSDWHASWAKSFSAWRVRQGQAPLALEEITWPVRTYTCPPAEAIET